MTPEGSPSVGEYLAALRRRRFLMACVAVPIMLIAMVLAIALPNVYRSHADFRLVTDRLTESVGDSGEYADQYVLSLADRVWGSAELENILREADPYPDLGENETSGMAELLDNVSVAMTTQMIIEPSAGRERTVNTGFTVSYENPSPEKAQLVAAGLGKLFIDLSRAERLTKASNKVKFYAGEADRTSHEIAEFEQQLSDFKERNFERLPETAQANIAVRGRLEQELDGVDREVRTLQQNRIFVMQQLRQAQAGPTVDSLRLLEDEYARKAAVYAENHPDVVTLRRQIESLRAAGPATGGNTLQAQLNTQRVGLAEARQRYSEDHPDIRRMMRNIETLEARISSGESPTTNITGESLQSVQLQTQLNAMDTQIAGLQGRSQQLRLRLEQFESRLGSTPEVEREYQAITRGLGTAKQQFDLMAKGRLEGEMEVAAITGGTADRFELESSPSMPREPSSPQRLAIVIVGLILATIAALTGVVAAEVLDASVRGAADVRRTLGRAPLAVVPEIHNSTYWRVRTRRVALLGGSVLIVTPVIYLLVYVLVN
jgi:uncharacterized protein involved in exopolysaccharide biosynthesis